MLDNGALAISLPPRELADVSLPGSVFAARDIAQAKLSPELRLAVSLIEGVCAEAGFAPRFIARPEIFPHGESLAWLRARLEGACDHLAISDGTTVPILPGFDNHVFFFRLGEAASARALRRLQRRAPELLGALHSQVNTTLRFGPGEDAPCPAPIAILGRDPRAPSIADFYPLVINPNSADDSLARLKRAGPRLRPPLGAERLDYIALTETGLTDRAFMREIARRLTRGIFDPERAMILRLPPGAEGSSAIDDRLRATLAALIEGDVGAPLAPAAQAVFATADIDFRQLDAIAGNAEFVTHDSFDFWRHSPRVYRGFASLHVFGRSEVQAPADFEALVEAMTGLPPTLTWLARLEERV